MSPNLVQRLSAETLGTLILVFFGAAAAVAATAGALGTASAFAVALALAVWVFGAVSGAHVNPAVTVALAARGRFPWLDVPGYVIAQLVGGFLGGLLAWGVYGTPAIDAGLGDAVRVSSGHSLLAGLVAEALVAFLLVLAYFALFADERVGRGAAGLGIGLAYGVAILALAPVTGASGNVARTFGIDLTLALGGGTARWGDLWIYVVAPLVGGIVAAYVHDVLIAGRPLMAATGRRVTTGRTVAHPA